MKSWRLSFMVTAIGLCAACQSSSGQHEVLCALLLRAHELPAGIRVSGAPENPSLTSDSEFIQVLTDWTWQNESPRYAGQVLYSVYEEAAEVGVVAFAFDSSDQVREAALGLSAEYEVFSTEDVLVLLWHDGVSTECLEFFRHHIKSTLEEE